MSKSERPATQCPVGRTLERVGDGWTLLILRDAAQGLTRFDQFEKSLGVAPNILTQRLAALVDGMRAAFREGRFEQGLYGCSEMFVNGLLQLVRAGIIKRQVFQDEALQRLALAGRLGENPSMAALQALCEMVGEARVSEAVRFDRRLRPGAVNTEVEIYLPGGNTVSALITHASCEALGLAEGMAATAIFKASSVIIGVPA